ncbi:MAG: ParA family protein [Gammaproteobacteria bacterium]|nr:ParA family protein [Gammaproteobacteria bacterium]CAJ2376801.1 MAG: Chromosome partitioning protein ParA [Arenicellales bacterium IbO2]MDA7961679.1 ParA family protein [Gammaproteobacteria bacterium]MDA7968504.1 ParA family protein [Gammaproteobacteria bacterium]MDA7970093.1 ParA family protein [Gammaproteobacteria bacterium]
MARVLAITNQKGGVGKTTTAINLCAALGAAGHRSLLVDMDPQGNATVGSGLAMRQLEQGAYEVLLGSGGIDGVILQTEGGYDIVPSHPDLSGAQVEMTGLERRDFRLADALAQVDSRYELIIIDCPPALNVLTVNALVAAREALIPVQCEYYALEGLTSLMQTIELIRRGLNPALQVLGLVRTMYDARNTLSNEVAAQLNAHFPEHLFRAVIPRNVRLAEAPSHGKTVLQYDRHCAGSQAYVALAGEVLRRRAA